MEIEARPEDDGRREGERKPLPAREVERREHRERDERRREGDGDDESPAHGSDAVGGLARLGREKRPVPGRLDGLEQSVHADAARVVAHGGGLGREVHRGGDAVDLVQLSLDPVSAGRARHPLEREVDALAARRGSRPRSSRRRVNAAASRSVIADRVYPLRVLFTRAQTSSRRTSKELWRRTGPQSERL